MAAFTGDTATIVTNAKYIGLSASTATAIGASAVVLTTKQWADSHTTTLSPSYPSKTTFPKMP